MKQLALFVALAVCMSISGKPQVKKKSSSLLVRFFALRGMRYGTAKRVNRTNIAPKMSAEN